MLLGATELTGTGPSFAQITYQPVEARGLGLFPTHFFGGFEYGFPVPARWNLRSDDDLAGPLPG
jgi:hypothetical protein